MDEMPTYCSRSSANAAGEFSEKFVKLAEVTQIPDGVIQDISAGRLQRGVALNLCRWLGQSHHGLGDQGLFP